MDRIDQQERLLLEDVLHHMGAWTEQVAAYQKQAAQARDFNVRSKGLETDFVTDVDLKSEDMLIRLIRRHYPDHGILGEENGRMDGSSDYVWLVDPLDGTTNYIHGFPLSAQSIALQHKGITVAGMVYAAGLDMKFWAVRESGAYLNGKRVHVSQTRDLKHSLLATGFPNDCSRHQLNLPYFAKMTGQVSGIRRTGSAALDLCFVAASYLDGFWEFDLNDWDTGAGALIVEEAGGMVERLQLDDHPLLVCGNKRLTPLLQQALLA
ncbi:inositol monophosphatase family protein [Paenibacillus sp. 1P07SE]|uniref:inositol monophosphatase family protein n=1 Tax=Paenibacillus sp. 1P07SE TaxID=3132209 RepID=UPI0039A73658